MMTAFLIFLAIAFACLGAGILYVWYLVLKRVNIHTEENDEGEQ